jgi:hypothetical protein
MAVSMAGAAVGSLALGTLARLPLVGGPREVLTDVEGADWSPDGRELAVRAWSTGATGRVLHRPGVVRNQRLGQPTRVSPDGQHVAFIDHLVCADDCGYVA